MPKITFRINLTREPLENLGPNTNLVNIHAILPVTVTDTWLPGLLRAENIQLKHGQEFTLEGQKAIYVNNMYVRGIAPPDRALLDVVERED